MRKPLTFIVSFEEYAEFGRVPLDGLGALGIGVETLVPRFRVLLRAVEENSACGVGLRKVGDNGSLKVLHDSFI